MTRDPAAGPACAVSSLAYRINNNWIYKLSWLPQEALDHAASRIDAALNSDYKIFSSILENMHDMKFTAVWPQSPRGDTLIDCMDTSVHSLADGANAGSLDRAPMDRNISTDLSSGISDRAL